MLYGADKNAVYQPSLWYFLTIFGSNAYVCIASTQFWCHELRSLQLAALAPPLPRVHKTEDKFERVDARQSSV
jgi:hypothetical protein